jgi:hypothetical protein
MTNYSGSKCPNCEWTAFETVEDTPLNSNYKLYFVRCAKCKTVVGIRDYLNTGAALQLIADKLGVKL